MGNLVEKVSKSVREITDLTFVELHTLRCEITEIINLKAKEEFKVGTIVRMIDDSVSDDSFVIVAVQVQYEKPRVVLYPCNRLASPTEVVSFDKVCIV